MLRLIVFQRLLRFVCFLIFELLILGHRSTSFFCAMQAPVGRSQLIPGLLGDLRISIGLDRAFEVTRGGGGIAEQHLGSAEVVIQVY